MRTSRHRLLSLATLLCAGAVQAAGTTTSEALVLTSDSSNRFAIGLYGALAREHADANLFFSPFSVATALGMTAEGARGETAAEMGELLGLPATLRNGGDDAGQRPWQLDAFHRGQAALAGRLTAADADADDRRAELAGLRAELERLQAQLGEQAARGAPTDLWQREQALAGRINTLAAQLDRYELDLASAIWGERSYRFEASFVDTVTRHYGDVHSVDFIGDFPAARERINAWSAERTRGRITAIVPDLPPDAARQLRLILTSAIYFKGEWLEPFEARHTGPRPFTLAGGTTRQVPIMHARGLEAGRYAAFNADGVPFETPRRISIGQTEGLYPAADGLAVLELPYKGGDLAMLVIAPNRPDGLADVERALAGGQLQTWIDALEQRAVHVYLPRFTLETRYTLNGTLQAMGMRRAFLDPRQPGGADFSGMSVSDDPRDRLYVSFVAHRAFVEVNEKGTEAAAVTAVGMAAATSMPVSVPFTPEFRADRPFIYLIRHRSSGTILFMGRMLQPPG